MSPGSSTQRNTSSSAVYIPVTTTTSVHKNIEKDIRTSYNFVLTRTTDFLKDLATFIRTTCRTTEVNLLQDEEKICAETVLRMIQSGTRFRQFHNELDDDCDRAKEAIFKEVNDKIQYLLITTDTIFVITFEQNYDHSPKVLHAVSWIHFSIY